MNSVVLKPEKQFLAKPRKDIRERAWARLEGKLSH
jgi:hypothetical protein